MFTLTIHASNADFYNSDGNLNPAAALASIIEALERLRRDGVRGEGKLYDTHGDLVGCYQFEE